jgi:membrane protein implicated in regulation of membrane protease activity
MKRHGKKIATTVACAGFICFVVIVFALAINYDIEKRARVNSTVLDEGVIEGMGIKCDGTSVCDDYYVEVNGKEWLVTEEDYIRLNIGDTVRIYDRYSVSEKRVEIIDAIQ